MDAVYMTKLIKEAKKLTCNLVIVTMIFMAFPNITWASSLPTFVADVTAPTTGSVNVTVNFPSGASSEQYSVNDGDWTNYSGPVKFTSNGTIEARYLYTVWIFSYWVDLGSYKVSNISSIGGSDDNNGDWALSKVTLKNTPEADLMVRVGNINNFGFGWDAGFDPFSGKSTRVHNFPWTPPSDPTNALDRIMVTSGYTYKYDRRGNIVYTYPTDGYTTATSRPDNQVRDIIMSYNLSGLTVNNAILQMFVDDFQAGPVVDNNSSPHRFNGHYVVTINKVEVPELETVINNLNQSGPIGRMISLNIPSKYLDLIRSGSIAINIDDKKSSEGDGYAVDFVKLLINPASLSQTCTVSGNVRDSVTHKGISGASVSAGGVVQTTTNSDGSYTLNKVPAGSPVITVTMDKYDSESFTIEEAVAGNKYTHDFDLTSTAKPGLPEITENPVTLTNQNVQITVNYPDNPAVKKIFIDKNNLIDASDPSKYSNYTGAVTVGNDWASTNDTWTIYAASQSASGVWSEIASTTIGNIDKSKPAAPTLTVGPTPNTNGSATVTAVFPSTGVKAGSQQISIDGGLTYTQYTGPVTITTNATIFAKYQNNAGTESVPGKAIVSIPAAPVLSEHQTTLPDGTVAAAITASYPGDAAVHKISYDNGNSWSDYINDGKSNVMTSNNTVLAYSINSSGISSSYCSLTVDDIKPGKPKLTEDVTTPTNQNVNVNIVYPASAVQKKYSLDGGITWNDYTVPISIGSNCTVEAQCFDSAGTASDTNFLQITNIDKTPPNFEIGLLRTNSNGSQVVGVVNNTDAEVPIITSMSCEPSNAGAPTGDGEFTCYANCTVTFTFKDAAGNTSSASYNAVVGTSIPMPPTGSIER